ncbi:UNVERIFIED_CONTAM: hypothetical protein GTU68_063083 [Idotea baltica]|nr:hypothetical protein [Idotea baltica]
MQSFSESGLRPEILSSLARIEFIKPTPIQEKSIKHMMSSDKDLIGLAHTGTGKTAAFALPILHRTIVEDRSIQTIILCPTRELCLQITKDVATYARDLRGFRAVAVYGGASMVSQVNEIKKGCQMVVGTPGRTLDLIKRRKLKLNNVRWLVLDEADEMLSMGFKDDLDEILAETPAEKQTLLFSATMPKEISRIAKNYMNDPVQVKVESAKQTTSTVSHSYYTVTSRNRFEVLSLLININVDIYAIVFCRTRRETREITEDLSRDGFPVDALHGELNQRQRDQVMDRFRSGKLKLLIATDVAARGLDVNDLTHVINYNLPDDLEAYVHRSGRTGRAGKKGESICLLNSREVRRLGIIERKTGIKFTAKQVPGKRQIISGKLTKFIEEITEANVRTDLIKEHMPEVEERLAELSKTEILERLVSREVKKQDRPAKREIYEPPSRNNRASTSSVSGDFTRFYINIGSKHGVDAIKLISIINQHMKGSHFEIGKIEILKSFSFFEIEDVYELEILQSFKKGSYEGIELTVEKSQPKPKMTKPKKHKKKHKKRHAR